jgi:hypothetical protein
MIRIRFYTLNNFSKLTEKLSPRIVHLMQLPLDQREAEVRQLFTEFDIPVDGKKEWCTWENDRDYTLFCLRWR